MSFAALHVMAANDFSYSVQGGQLKVSFITPDIVRVQYSPDGEFRSNNTGVCVPHSFAAITQVCVYHISRAIFHCR